MKDLDTVFLVQIPADREIASLGPTRIIPDLPWLYSLILVGERVYREGLRKGGRSFRKT